MLALSEFDIIMVVLCEKKMIKILTGLKAKSSLNA